MLEEIPKEWNGVENETKNYAFTLKKICLYFNKIETTFRCKKF